MRESSHDKIRDLLHLASGTPYVGQFKQFRPSRVTPESMEPDPSIDRYLRDFDFELPEEAIARYPAAERTDSRLLVVDLTSDQLHDRRFYELPELLAPGDLLVANDTRVSKRRLRLRRQTGARLEALFLEPLGDGGWSVLLRGAGRVRDGELLEVETPGTPGGAGDPLLIGKGGDRGGRAKSEPKRAPPVRFRLVATSAQPGPGNRCLRPETTSGETAWPDPEAAEDFFQEYGELPIPPYLGRPAEASDEERYQTVIARRSSSSAAPTAGLHFDDRLWERLAERGVERAHLELVIGYGTFAPLQQANFEERRLHKERYEIPEETCSRFAAARGRRIAVGTTTLRALESEWRRSGRLEPGARATELFLRPPQRITAVEGLITNFHLPRSSLLLLVACLVGRERLLEAYRHALREGYRFYSYGDAMLVLGSRVDSS